MQNNSLSMQRFLALFILQAALLCTGHAQLSVNIDVKRRTYIRYEPVLATVSITNLSGRDLILEDGSAPWFGFSITQGDGETLLSPRNPGYRLDPLPLKLGETVKRQVNLVDLYPITEYGIHRVKAVIYSKDYDKFFASRTANLDISEGRLLWKQSVGVPETMPRAGQIHQFELLSAHGVSRQFLYCRVSHPETAIVFGCYRLGYLLDGAQFDAKFDATNTLHVLQLIGPKTYTLTQIGVNGEVFGQWVYDAPRSKPFLRNDGTGNLTIVGATRRVAAAKNEPDAPPAKLSDRPPGLPR
jgi:hypothetical protein